MSKVDIISGFDGLGGDSSSKVKESEKCSHTIFQCLEEYVEAAVDVYTFKGAYYLSEVDQ